MDNLQTLWHKAQSPEDEAALSNQQIDKMVRQKSYNEFENFRWIVMWEFWGGIIGTPILLYAFRDSVLLTYPFLLIILLLIQGSFCVWQYHFLRQINRVRFAEDVHHYLVDAISVMKRYVFNYRIISAVVFPAGLAFGFLAGKDGDEPFVIEMPDQPVVAIVIGLCCVGLSLLVLHFQIEYFFQRKINRLRKMLKELQ